MPRGVRFSMVHEVGQGASEAIEAPHDERVVLFGLG
jgi:hypothetical protein